MWVKGVHTWVSPALGLVVLKGRGEGGEGELPYPSPGLAHSLWLWMSSQSHGMLSLHPLPHQHPVISGRGSSRKCPPSPFPCPEPRGAPSPPSHPSSGLLFIYLIIYFSYLLVFIDNWKSGGAGGGVISAAHWGQLGLPPYPAPLHFWGAAGSNLRGRDFLGPHAPISPFCWGRGRKGNPSGACREGTRCFPRSLQELGAAVLPALPIPIS